MIPKFLIVALSGILIIQTCHVYCQESNTTAPPAKTASDQEFENANATKTINALLRHFRIIMTNPVSASVVRYIATSVRYVLTSEVGQKNAQHLTDFIVDTLMDSNTLANMKVFHRRLVQLAASGRGAPIVLETAADASRRILDEPQLLAAAEGLIEGINILLEDMTEQKLRDGIARVAKLQKLASFFKPKKILDKIPGLQKLKKSNSEIAISNVEGDRELQLQTRGMRDGNEYGWINRQGKGEKSKNKKGDGADELDTKEM